jgi:exodeoxyribonuclease VII large subunit
MGEALRHEEELLDRSIQKLIERERGALSTALERLNALNPLAVLARGYSAVQDGEGRIVSSVTELSEGERVTVLMKDGHAEAEILSKTLNHDGGSHGK